MLEVLAVAQVGGDLNKIRKAQCSAVAISPTPKRSNARVIDEEGEELVSRLGAKRTREGNAEALREAARIAEEERKNDPLYLQKAQKRLDAAAKNVERAREEVSLKDSAKRFANSNSAAAERKLEKCAEFLKKAEEDAQEARERARRNEGRRR